MNIKNVLLTSCFIFATYSIGYNARADEEDILKLIDSQIEKNEQLKKEQVNKDNKTITISKEDIIALIDKRIAEKNNAKAKQDAKNNTMIEVNTTEKEKQINEEEIRKIVKETLAKTKKTSNESTEEKNKKKEQDVLTAINNDAKQDTNNNINDNQLNTEEYQSKTKKYGWHVNLGATSYYNPYNKKGLNAGLTLDLYYRWKDYGFLVGVDGIWHNVLSGDYRKFKSDNYGEAGEIREKYSVLFKTGFIGFVNDDWSWQLYMLLGWGNSNVKVWDINGYGTSLNQYYVRGGFGLKVVYKRIYMGITWLAGAPSEIHYTNIIGEDVVWNIQHARSKNGTEYTYVPTEHNVLLSFGIKFL